MNEKPAVLIVSSSNTKPKSLIKLLTKSSTIEEDKNDPNKLIHSWTIDTKYYTADINVIGINETYKRNEDFNKNIEALIIHMDSNKESGLEDLKVWENIEEDCDPDVKLLISNYCTQETKVTKNQAIEWCLKKGFELIELYPSPENIDIENKEIIEEKIGIERVVEALQAHTWSNLIMKKLSTKIKQQQKNEDEDSLGAEEFLTSEGMDDFSDLFSQLSMMKDSLQSMPMSQRKQCAEQMVTAFWKAIGGDEEEITDI